MNKMIFLMSITSVMIACSNNDKDYEATGTFEATEVTVSAEGNGKLISFNVDEGNKITCGDQVGLIDTVQLALKAKQLGATKESFAYQRPDVEAQIAATRQELVKAQKEANRQKALLKDNAGTQKQLDDAINTVNVLKRQLEAQLSSLGNSTKSLSSQMSATDIQRAQILDELNKCHIISPITGTILEKYAECGEYAAIGKPLFKIADIDNLFLRAYITSLQLQKIKVGQKVKVMADYGDGKRKTYDGTITWISSQSEFTPKTILTDDERADQVYAVKIAVKNDGGIKIGMYGEDKL